MSTKGLWINQQTFVDLAAPDQSLSRAIATRDRSIDFYSLSTYLPNPDPVLKKTGKDITVYRDIKVDPHLGSVWESRQSGTRKLLWEIDRGRSKSRAAKFIESIFKNLDMDRIVSEMLEASYYGYQILEVMWEIVGNQFSVKDLVGKPQEWFVYDGENNLRFRTRDNPYDGILCPPNKFLQVRRSPSYQNPYGVPVAASCFWPVTFKRGGWKFWVTFAEKFGIPWVIGKYRPGSSQAEKDEMLDMLDKMVQDGIAIIPENTSVDTLEAKGGTSGADTHKGLCDFCNIEMSKAVLGHGAGADATAGRLGNEQMAREVRQDVIDADTRMVTSALNHLIAVICEMNFGNVERPSFCFYKEEDVDDKLAARDKNLVDQGVRFSIDYYKRAYGFEDDEIVAVQEPSAAQPVPPDNDPATAAQSAPGRSRPQGTEPLELAGGSAGQEISLQDLDMLAEEIPPSLLQDGVEKLLEPVLAIIEKSDSFQDMKTNVVAAFPDMTDTTLQILIEKAILLAQLRGASEET